MRQVLVRNLLAAAQRKSIVGLNGPSALAVRYLATVTEYFPNKVDFPSRHIGPRKTDVVEMLDLLGYKSLDDLTNEAVPRNIQLNRGLVIEEALSECDFPKNICKTVSLEMRDDIVA